MADIGLGYGLGLQSRPDTSAFRFAEQDNAHRAQEKAASIREKQKQDEQFSNILKDVKVEGVHNLDREDAQHTFTNALNTVQEEKKRNPNNYLNAVEPILKDAMFKQAQLVERNKVMKDQEESYQEQLKNGYITPYQQKFRELVNNGTWEDIYKLPPDVEQSVSFDPTKKTFNYNFIPRIDTNKIKKDLVANDDLKAAYKEAPDSDYKSLKGERQYVRSQYLPLNAKEAEKFKVDKNAPTPVAAEDLATTYLSDPRNIKVEVNDLRRKGLIPDEFYDKSPKDQLEFIKPIMANQIQQLAGTKRTFRVEQPFAPLRAQTSQGDEYGNEDINKDLGFNGEDGVTQGMEERQNYIAKGAKSFVVKKANIATPEGTIDAATGQPVKDAGVAKNYTIGSAQNVPIIIDGEHKGNRASEQYIKMLQHNKADLSKYIRYETMTPASYSEQVQETNANGKKLTDANGAPIYKNIEKQVFLPAKAIHGTLESGKQPAKLGELVKRADEVNNSLNSNTSQSSSQPKQISSQVEYDAIPKGQKYISGGKTYVKQ